MVIEEKNWTKIGKKHDWVEQRRGELVYRLIIFDNNRPIDKFIWNTKNKFKEILELLNLKYGMSGK